MPGQLLLQALSTWRQLSYPSALCLTLVLGQAWGDPLECPEEWHLFEQGQQCFLLDATQTLSWEQARTTCQSYGGDLTKIPDSKTNTFLTGLIPSSCPEYWIGLHDTVTENVFQWLDEDGEANFTNWAPDEPNDFGDEDCVYISGYGQGHWNDAICGAYLGLSCQKPLGASLDERISIAAKRNDELYLDGFLSEDVVMTKEWTQWVAMNLDFLERIGLKSFSSPIYDKTTYIAYIFDKGPKMVQHIKADAFCLIRGGYLVEVDNSKEWDFLISFLANQTFGETNGIFIAGRRSEENPQFLSSRTGRDVTTFIKWHSYQPDYHGQVENCLELYKYREQFWEANDMACSNRRAFICEVQNVE